MRPHRRKTPAQAGSPPPAEQAISSASASGIASSRSSDGTTEFRDDIDADGYRVGAGAEYALGTNSFAKLEYRYSNYKKAEIDLGGTLPDGGRFNVDTDRHQIVAGFGYRF